MSNSLASRRSFLKGSLAAGAALTMPACLKAQGANDRIRLGLIGAGGRGGQLADGFSKLRDAKIVAVADPDESHAGGMARKLGARPYADARRLLEDKTIDAVIIATCNHWHCLAAIWACQAGKDVYVEKPLGHNQREGEMLFAAAKKYDRIVQVGTQQRSDPVQQEIKDFIDSGKIGKPKWIHANRYGVRGPIGKRAAPLEIPSTVDYDLWLGPALDEPIFRNSLHYDWHWDFNTGNGEMGNWGVHILDDVRNVGTRDRCTMPLRVLAGGGRVVWDDAGDTPNVHFAYYDTGVVPVVFGLTNLPSKPGAKGSLHYKGTGSGYVIECEGGWYAGGRGGGAACDQSGAQIAELKGNSGQGHDANFLQAVRARDASILNSDVVTGHHSSGWCNVANIAYRVGGAFSQEEAMEINRGYGPWEDLLGDMEEHLAAHGVRLSDKSIRLSPVLEMDPKTERFVGPTAEAANKLLTREYRKAEFTIGETV